MRQKLSSSGSRRHKRRKGHVVAGLTRPDWLVKTGERAQGKRRTAEDHHQEWDMPDESTHLIAVVEDFTSSFEIPRDRLGTRMQPN